MSIYRLTGVVETASRKEGTSRAGKAYSIPTLNVRVNDFVVTEVTLLDADAAKYDAGSVVDLIVDVTANGGFTSARVTGDWPVESTAAHLRTAS